MIGCGCAITCGITAGVLHCVHNWGVQGCVWHGTYTSLPWQQTTGGWWLIGATAGSCIVGIVGAGGKYFCLATAWWLPIVQHVLSQLGIQITVQASQGNGSGWSVWSPGPKQIWTEVYLKLYTEEVYWNLPNTASTAIAFSKWLFTQCLKYHSNMV